MFERSARRFGASRMARILTLLVTSALFALGHIVNMGRDGAVQALFSGVTLGAIYLATGRIWMSIIAHAAFDLVALWIIYSGNETRMAHLFFG